MKTKKEKTSFTDKELNAGLILSFFRIIFNVVYQNIEKIKESISEFSFLYVIIFLRLICTLISIYHSVNKFIPRIEKKYDPNVFFFGDIVSKFGDINQFSKTFLKSTVDKEKIYDQIGQQIFINVKITTLKFKFHLNNMIVIPNILIKAFKLLACK